MRPHLRALFFRAHNTHTPSSGDTEYSCENILLCIKKDEVVYHIHDITINFPATILAEKKIKSSRYCLKRQKKRRCLIQLSPRGEFLRQLTKASHLIESSLLLCFITQKRVFKRTHRWVPFVGVLSLNLSNSSCSTNAFDI